MKKKKQIIPTILFILAAIIAILGILQLALYISPQLTMVKEAAAQGATTEQISEYYWQQLIPQIITYLITSLGIAALLFSSGVIYRKLTELLNPAIASVSEDLITPEALDCKNKGGISDDFFDDFEIPQEERK